MTAARHTIDAFEAKSEFPALLDKVEHGAEITITENGRPVARLIPVAPSQSARLEAAADLRLMRKRYSLKGRSIKKLIERGRR